MTTAEINKKGVKLEDLFDPEILEFVKSLPKWKQKMALRIAPTKKHFNSIKKFHKNRAKLPYEEKVAQVIELQKIDMEFSKHRNG